MSLDRFDPCGPQTEADVVLMPDRTLAAQIADKAEEAASLLKAMSHSGRLMILCHLAGGERSVTELEQLLGQRQAAVSQQLARLRLEGLVTTRRVGKTIIYAIDDRRVLDVLRGLPAAFAA